MLRPITSETSKTAKIILVLYWGLGYKRSHMRSMAQYKMIFAVLDVSLIMGLNIGETDKVFYIAFNRPITRQHHGKIGHCIDRLHRGLLIVPTDAQTIAILRVLASELALKNRRFVTVFLMWSETVSAVIFCMYRFANFKISLMYKSAQKCTLFSFKIRQFSGKTPPHLCPLNSPL